MRRRNEISGFIVIGLCVFILLWFVVFVWLLLR